MRTATVGRLVAAVAAADRGISNITSYPSSVHVRLTRHLDRGLFLPVLRGAQALEDLLAGGTHRELLGVTTRHPDLAAERHHRISGHGAVHDLVLADIVREALVVPRLADLLFDPLALDD